MKPIGYTYLIRRTSGNVEKTSSVNHTNTAQNDHPVLHISRQYALFRWGFAVFLLVFTISMVVIQFMALYKYSMHQMEAKALQYQQGLDIEVKEVIDNLQQSKMLMETSYVTALQTNYPPLCKNGFVYYKDEDYYALDLSNTHDVDIPLGNMFGMGMQPSNDSPNWQSFTNALSAFPLYKSEIRTSSLISRIFFISNDDFVTVYPPITTDGLIHNTSMSVLIRDGFNHGELLQQINMQDYANTKIVWGDIHQEVVSGNWNITAGIPVFQGTEYKGAILFDIDIDQLMHISPPESIAPFRILLLNQNRKVLFADGFQLQANRNPAQPIEAALSDESAPIIHLLASENSKYDWRGDHYLAFPFTSAPWILITSISQMDVFRNMQTQLLLIFFELGLLALFIFVTDTIIRLNFVKPALSIYRKIYDDTFGGDSPSTPLPHSWNDLYQHVSDIFTLKKMTANLPGAVLQFVTNADGSSTIQYASKEIRRFTGGYINLLHRSCDMLIQLAHPDDQIMLRTALQKARIRQSDIDTNCRFVLPSTEVVWGKLIAHPQHGKNGQIIWNAILLDITDQKAIEENLHQLATIDSLTGTLSRQHFMSLAENEAKRAQRFHKPLSVLYCDIDRFKEINDQYGHFDGDDVLKEICVRMKQNLRDFDLLGRLGGDEFVIVLIECSQQQAEEIAGRICECIRETQIQTQQQSIPVTISIGLAERQETDMAFVDTLKRADQNLLKAKANGKNQIKIG